MEKGVGREGFLKELTIKCVAEKLIATILRLKKT
jgi:hypothetical protein